MDKLAIHIVEDEAVIAMDLEDTLQELGHHVTGISANYEEVMRILPHDQSDIFLVDIQLNGIRNGIDVARELNKAGKIHIYISSLSAKQIIEQARDTSPQGYILKPFNSTDIFVAVAMASGRMDQLPIRPFVFIKEGKGQTKISMNDILYAKADGHYTHIFTHQRKHTLLRNLKKVQAELLTNNFFKHVHKSYLVNTLHIKRSDNKSVILNDGSCIPLSRNYKREEL